MLEQYSESLTLGGNFASGTVDTQISAVATSLDLETGQGANFPDPASVGRYVIGWEGTLELALVTAKSSDTLTIQRGYEGTVAAIHAEGETVKVVMSAKPYSDLRSRLRRTERLVSKILGGGDGIVNGNDTPFTIEQQTVADMTVKVSPGIAVINGEPIELESSYTTPTFSAPGSDSQIFLIVLTLGDSNGVVVVSGTIAATPVAPALPSDSVALGEVLLTSGHTTIQTADITNNIKVYL